MIESKPQNVSYVKVYNDDLQDFIKDESNVRGGPVAEVSFPENSQDLSDYFTSKPDFQFFVNGAGTGVVGGAVPISNEVNKTAIVSLSRCKNIANFQISGEHATISVGAGVTLIELETYLLEHYPDYYFPVDPTEKWASFGGMASTNASGARSFHYSSIRKWIEALSVVLVDGKILKFTRGEDRLKGLSFDFYGIKADLFEFLKPKTKNSLGYFCRPDCDVVDLFVGAEGTLGVITELKLKLLKKTNTILPILQFFPDAKAALNFVKEVRLNLKKCCISLEFLDHRSVSIALGANVGLSEQIEKITGMGNHFVVFLEMIYGSEDEFVEIYEKLESLLSSVGGDFSLSICGVDDSDIAAIKKFRHAVPEGVNKKIAAAKLSVPEIRKVSTDMAVPDSHLDDLYYLYKNVLDKESIDYCIFGHVGDNHFHVNLLPKTKAEMERSIELYAGFAMEVVKMDGAVSAEHGIGRIKKDFLRIQYSDSVIAEMKRIKRIFDPEFRLSPGILLDQ